MSQSRADLILGRLCRLCQGSPIPYNQVEAEGHLLQDAPGSWPSSMTPGLMAEGADHKWIEQCCVEVQRRVPVRTLTLIVSLWHDC